MSINISEFYKDKTVLLTGATGFIGKTLVEKLLRDCPDIRVIYAIIRPQKDISGEQRLKEIFQNQLFDTLRQINPEFEAKVIVIEGDVSLPNLGIGADLRNKRRPLVLDAHQQPQQQHHHQAKHHKENGGMNGLNGSNQHHPHENQEEDEKVEEEVRQIMERLRKEVSIVLHCAATVNFNERLSVSLGTNVLSVYHLLNFARTLDHLDAFVHVSTAYAHCDRLHIEEKFYPPIADPLYLVKTIATMSEEMICNLTPSLVAKRPNTYTLTKSLAEDLLRSTAHGLPVAVVRPSIVTGIAEGPIKGWTDNLNGPGGLYIAVAHNLLRVMPGDPNAICDFVPVDYCTNLILAVAWKLAMTKPKEPTIYNFTSGTSNPVRWNLHNKLLLAKMRQQPITGKRSLVRQPSFQLYKASFTYRIWEYVSHTLPALAVDFFRRLQGKRPFMQRLYGKLSGSVGAYSYFTMREWRWDHENSTQLFQEMTPSDQKRFNFNVASIEWGPYLYAYYDWCKILAKEKEQERDKKNRKAVVPINQEADCQNHQNGNGNHGKVNSDSNHSNSFRFFSYLSLTLVSGAMITALYIYKGDFSGLKADFVKFCEDLKKEK